MLRPPPPLGIVGFNPPVDDLPVDDKPVVDSPPVVDDNSLQGIGGFDPRPRGNDGVWALEAIYLNFESVEGGRVVKVSLYYDGCLVIDGEPPIEVGFTTDEAIKYGYVPPKGISVTLDLYFPSEKSGIKLYSVTLVYKALPQRAPQGS